MDQNLVSDLRKRPEIDLNHVISCSPIMHCFQGTPLQQPVTISLPCPPQHHPKPQRPASSASPGQRKPPEKKDDEGKDRPATARPFFVKKQGEMCFFFHSIKLFV